MKIVHYLLLMLPVVLGTSCSHKFNADVQDLNFYQWNLWLDAGAEQADGLPSCGWEELHRGKGKLVRIPAALEEHFPEQEGGAVYWYHCRFTLPEQWEGRPISLVFEKAGPFLEVFLNEKEVGSFRGEEGAFELDVSESIFYVRDNHLSIKVVNGGEYTSGQPDGITGTILVVPGSGEKKEQESTE